MGSFNSFVQKKVAGNGSIPVWLGVVSPLPVGGALASKFCKAGMFIPAGTPVNLNEGVITPMTAYEVVAVDSTDHIITVKGNGLILPEAGDCMMILGTTFATTGACAAVSSIAPAATAGQYDITMTDGKVDSATAGKYLVFADASAAAASGKSMKAQPNGYLYNDIAIDAAVDGVTFSGIGASGAVVRNHAEGILINNTPAAIVKTQMKEAVPGVEQINY